MNLEQLELKPTDGDQYLASVDGKYFYIGPLLYEIAVRAKSLRSPAEIVADLKRDLAINLNEEQVQSALDDIEQKINPEGNEEGASGPQQRSSYIHFQIKLLGGALLEKFTKTLSILFRPSIATVLIVLSLLTTAAYYLFAERPSVRLSTQELVAAYLVLFFVFLIHELGHAAATKYYGMKPHEISFGFYLVFPVFFADVSEAWSLNKYKRIVINLGGVYFQLIVNALLVGFAFCFPNSSVLTTLLYTNLIVVCYSLMPFIRYDGYWIYSDYFDLPNLMGRSIVYPYQLWVNFRKKSDEPINRPLLVYSVSSYLFFTVMFYYVGRFVAKSIEAVNHTIASSSLGWTQFFMEAELSFFFRLAVVVFMVSFMSYRLVRYGWNKFLKII